jgi:hypothetical protein
LLRISYKNSKDLTGEDMLATLNLLDAEDEINNYKIFDLKNNRQQ